MRGGQARFPDLRRRLNAALAEQGVRDPSRWCADTTGGLDARALAETVNLPAPSPTCCSTTSWLDWKPSRWRSGCCSARPSTGSRWTRPASPTVATPVEPPADPERQARIERVQRAWTEAEARGEQFDLSPAEAEQYQRDLQEHT